MTNVYEYLVLTDSHPETEATPQSNRCAELRNEIYRTFGFMVQPNMVLIRPQPRGFYAVAIYYNTIDPTALAYVERVKAWYDALAR